MSYFKPEEVHVTNALWKDRTDAKKLGRWTPYKTAHSAALKARLWVLERALWAAAGGSRGKGWDVRVKYKGKRLGATRRERWRLVRNCRLRRAKGGKASQYEKKAAGRPERAVAAGLSQRGVRESPYGSNWGPPSKFIRAIGWSQPIPWCGAFAGWCLKQAGVKGITSRVASVYAIYEDARAGRNGFSRLVSKREARPGDLVGLFSRSTHVGVVVRNNGSSLSTIEGNTSGGSGGSQANGGGVFARTRSMSSVAYIARPKF